MNLPTTPHLTGWVCLAKSLSHVLLLVHPHTHIHLTTSHMHTLTCTPSHAHTIVRILGDMVDGTVYRHSSGGTLDLQRRLEKEMETEKGSKRGSVFHKFGSLRKSWKKAPSKSSPPDLMEQHNFVRETNRMSLPSHFRRQVRPGLSSDTFSHQGMDPQGLNKAISLSSGEDEKRGSGSV